MIVMDGIVMGHQYCAVDGCLEELFNYHNEVFCQTHLDTQGQLCHIQSCPNHKITGTKACRQHQERWRKHVLRFGHSSMLGIRRVLRRTEEEEQRKKLSHGYQPYHAEFNPMIFSKDKLHYPKIISQLLKPTV
jgi:hypothetical protein